LDLCLCIPVFETSASLRVIIKYITLGGRLAYKEFNKFGEQIDKFSKPTSVNYDLLGVKVYGQILVHFFKKGFFFCFYSFREYLNYLQKFFF
jgi:hypothetical protein